MDELKRENNEISLDGLIKRLIKQVGVKDKNFHLICIGSKSDNNIGFAISSYSKDLGIKTLKLMAKNRSEVYNHVILGSFKKTKWSEIKY